MTRPTAREFAARWWDFRPTSGVVAVMTLAAVLCNALLGWPVWASAAAVIGSVAAWSAFLALLELSNEASDLPAEEAAPEAGES